MYIIPCEIWTPLTLKHQFLSILYSTFRCACIFVLDKEPSECPEQNYNNFDDDDDNDEDYKRPLRAPKNRENVFGEIPGTCTFCIVDRIGK